jgi:hypothetical protein
VFHWIPPPRGRCLSVMVTDRPAAAFSPPGENGPGTASGPVPAMVRDGGRSSVGQSDGLIIRWSLVRVQPAPPGNRRSGACFLTWLSDQASPRGICSAGVSLLSDTSLSGLLRPRTRPTPRLTTGRASRPPSYLRRRGGLHRSRARLRGSCRGFRCVVEDGIDVIATVAALPYEHLLGVGLLVPAV